MKVTVKTQHLYQIAATNPQLFGYINTLGIIQANGRLPQAKGNPGELNYEGIDNKQVPIGLYTQYFAEPLIQVDEYPLFIYAPITILDQNIWEGLPDRTHFVNDEDNPGEQIEVVKTFSAWGVAESYTNPIFENETHVILRTNISGQFLPDESIQVLIDKDGTEGVELLGMGEMFAKAAAEFPQEEI